MLMLLILRLNEDSTLNMSELNLLSQIIMGTSIILVLILQVPISMSG